MLLGTLKRRGGRAALWLVVGLLIGGAAGVGVMYVLKQGKKGISGGPRLGEADEMASVPGDAAGFVHIRLRGLYDTEGFADVRKIVDAAGDKAKAALDESFVPAPSTLDRMTLVFINTPPAPGAAAPGAPPAIAPLPIPKKGPNVPRQNARQPKAGFPPAPKGPGGPAFVPPFGDIGDFIPPIDTDLKVVVLLAFNAPFDAEKVRSAHAKNAVSKKIGEREYWEDPDSDVAMYFPSKTAMALGDPATIRHYLVKLNNPTAGALAKSIEHAQKGGRHFVAALNLAQLGIPTKGLENAEGEFKDVSKNLMTVMKAESLMLGMALTDEGTKIDIRAKYKDDAAATASESALRDLAKFAKTKLADPKKQMDAAVNGPAGGPKPRPIRDLQEAIGGLLGLGALNVLDEWLADPPLKTDGSEVVLTPKVPSIAAMYTATAAASVGLLLPATQKVRVSAARMKDSNNLKLIGLAMHNFHDVNVTLPPQGGKRDPKASDGLSWRVHLLPHLEQDALYKQFKLDEPWDSEHNKKLIDKMPAVYASPLTTDPLGQTRYKVFSGRDAVIFPGSKVTLVGITDGTSNTILVVGGGAPVIWTKPDDIEFTGTANPSVLTLPGQTGCNICMCDGSVRWIELGRLTPDKLKAAITRASGEVDGLDW